MRLVSSAKWGKLRAERAIGRDVPWLPGDPAPERALESIVGANEHGLYCIPRSSLGPIAQTILRSRVYEPNTIALMCSTDPEEDIVHAGAFIGDFLPALSKSRRSGAIVWAFEPNRWHYRCAQITCILNDLDNVVLTNAGLGVREERALLQTVNRAGLAIGGSGHLVDAPEGVGTTEEVQLLAIDETVGLDRWVAVLQLDVEGHEEPALAGAMGTIERCRPLIIVETLPESRVMEDLSNLGYRAAGVLDGNHVLRAPR